ncbi:sigma-70 family RNA polymerase sigma factor [bacterium]|nr:sigma-70 family RNA polymerase sigma factor [Candidatus Brocadiia bacterium]NQT53019.1 sigma-70 family RNA polymerase sigma factor [bacterium]
MAPPTSPFDRLWQEYQATGRIGRGPRQAKAILDALTPIARRVRRAMDDCPALDDLISAGALGLLEALQRFDPTYGVRLETFAGWRIVGAMYDDQRKFAWARGALRLNVQRARAAAEEIQQAKGRPADDHEVAAALGISTAALAEAHRFADHPEPLSLDALDRSGTGGPSDRSGDPMQVLLASEARTLLLDALKRLPENQRYTLLLYYFEQLTQVQIGCILGVSEGRVSQIRSEALQRLIRRLGPRGKDLLDALGD